MLLLVGGLLASFLLVFTFDSLEEYKEDVWCVIKLLDEKGFSSEKILKVLSFYE